MFEACQHACPLMLAVSGIIREPDLLYNQCRAQVIHVPVGFFGNFHVMGDAGFESAGAEGTADIHIEAGSSVKRAELSDLHLLLRRTPHDQSICPGP